MTTDTISHLRTEMMYAWLLAEGRLDPNDLKRDPQFADVEVDTIRIWAREDGWERKREELYETLIVRLDKRVMEEIHRDRKESLGLLRDLLDIARSRLKEAPAKTFEGVLRAITSVVATMEELNRAALGSISPTKLDTGAGDGLLVLPMSESTAEEIDAAKIAYLAARRERFARESSEKAANGEAISGS